VLVTSKKLAYLGTSKYFVCIEFSLKCNYKRNQRTLICCNFDSFRLCTKDGILKGFYGREQLTPAPQHDAKALGIQYSKLDKTKPITMTEAGEMFCPVGGKLSYCRCKKDCGLSKTCKCRKMNKFCTQHCHGGKGSNVKCTNCAPESD
jgi:hypothetical protein